MKIIVNSFLSAIMWLWSKVYTYKINQLVWTQRSNFRKFQIGHLFGRLGNSTIIGYRASFYGHQYIAIGDNTVIQDYTNIEAHFQYMKQSFSPQITIGNNCNIGEYNHISAIGKLTIGDGLLTGRRVTISDNNHGKFSLEDLMICPAQRKLSIKGDVKIGNNVWIGENACVLSGVTIGDGSVVAANAVVVNNVPPYSLVAGIPARIIKRIDL